MQGGDDGNATGRDGGYGCLKVLSHQHPVRACMSSIVVARRRIFCYLSAEAGEGTCDDVLVQLHRPSSWV